MIPAAKKHTGRTALYFEDDPDVVAGISLMIKGKLGFEVEVVQTPSSAKAEIGGARKFDLLILDIRIQHNESLEPGQDNGAWTRFGHEFLRQLRAGELGGTNAKVPVLILTGVVNTEDVDSFLRTGGADGCRCQYLAKPASFMAIEKKIDELLA